MAEAKRYLRPDEVAKRFEVTVRTLMNWWKTGETCLEAWHPNHKIGGRGLLFTTESVILYEQTNKIDPSDWEELQPVVPIKKRTTK